MTAETKFSSRDDAADFFLSVPVEYDPESGLFRWTHSAPGRKAFSRAGFRSNRHLSIVFAGHSIKAHRLAWLKFWGNLPTAEIDHINGDGFDNRIANLRECTRSQNCINQKLARDSTTGFKGVHFNQRKQKFEAYIRAGQKRTWLGYFPTAEYASEAYEAAALISFGEFACAGEAAIKRAHREDIRPVDGGAAR
jgi:hypothetical protein